MQAAEVMPVKFQLKRYSSFAFETITKGRIIEDASFSLPQ